MISNISQFVATNCWVLSALSAVQHYIGSAVMCVLIKFIHAEHVNIDRVLLHLVVSIASTACTVEYMVDNAGITPWYLLVMTPESRQVQSFSQVRLHHASSLRCPAGA